MADPQTTNEDNEALPLYEETARIALREVTTGRVRVETHVETFEQLARLDLHEDAVEVSRVSLNQPVTGPLPQVRTEGDVTIIPVFEEVLVVEKRLVLKEEIRVRKRRTVEAVEVPVTLRRQTADIVREEASAVPSPNEDLRQVDKP